MNIVIPAEASLDVLKAAYAVWRRNNLRLTNIEIAYPTSPFRVFDGDVLIGMYISTDRLSVTSLTGFRDTMEYLGNPPDMRFLEHVPSQLPMFYYEQDKTLLVSSIFGAFNAFAKNLRDAASISELLSGRSQFSVGQWNVVVAAKDQFLTPEERVRLFRSDIHYIVFASGNTVGVQKCMSRPCPLLTTFAEKHLSQDKNWFVHRRGHLVSNKNGCAPEKTGQELADLLREYLTAAV